MTTLTSQYIVLELKMFTDLARLGAQVIAGIGFIGAGTIIVTKNKQVKGLTTAAGLWATATVGLAVGAGFFEGAILATVIILVAELLLSRLEYIIVSRAKRINILVEYTDSSKLANIVDSLKKNNAYIVDMEINKTSKEKRNICAVFSVRLPRRVSRETVVTHISKIECVVAVEEL